MPVTKKKILCLSRSYLSKLYPTIDRNDEGREYFHIVMTNQEAKRVRALGGEVALNLEAYTKKEFANKCSVPNWSEPSDFREITGFEWSPLYSDRYLITFPEKNRLKIAGILSKAIDELFKSKMFDYFLSEPVALFVTHLIYYHCEKSGTRARFWANCFFPQYFYFSSALDYSIPIKKDVMESKNDELNKGIEKFCAAVVADKAGPAYHFSFAQDANKNLNFFKQRVGDASLVLLPGISTVFLQLLRLSRALLFKWTFPYKGDFQSSASFGEHWFYLKCLLTSVKYYDALPGEDVKAIVYPLQYEPEASLLYAAPDFFDQFSFVESLLRALPSDQVLYVKEHPNQFGALGLKQWRRLRKRYHNVKFIYGRESGRELIKRSMLVVTISSTAGVDALLFGKKVIVAGRVYYIDCENVVKLNSISKLPQLLNSMSPDATREMALASVVKIQKNMAKYSYAGDPQPSPYLYEKANINNLVLAIASECS